MGTELVIPVVRYSKGVMANHGSFSGERRIKDEKFDCIGNSVCCLFVPARL